MLVDYGPRYLTNTLRSRETQIFLSLSNVRFESKFSLGWTKYDEISFFTFKVSLIAVSQSHNLRSSRFTIFSNILRLLSAYKMFVSSANKKN